jgi:hypothetical protein
MRRTIYGRKEYDAYARECLDLAEWVENPNTRDELIALARLWMEPALRGRLRALKDYP